MNRENIEYPGFASKVHTRTTDPATQVTSQDKDFEKYWEKKEAR